MKQLLIFILFAGMICWLMFSSTYRHVLIMRQALMQKEADYLLEVGAAGMYGYIDQTMEQASRNRLAAAGLDPDELRYEVTTDTGHSAMDRDHPVPRGTGIRLRITYPYADLLRIDRLIGVRPPDDSKRLSAVGMKMSEYVP